MKLSDIKGDRTFDVIAEVIEPIANIAEDKEAAQLFKREKCPDGVDPKKFLVDKCKKCFPKLIKGHKNDIVTILAAIEGVTTKEYTENLSLAKLLIGFIELMTDEAFMAFFQ